MSSFKVIQVNLQNNISQTNAFIQSLFSEKISLACLQDAYLVNERITGLPLGWPCYSSTSRNCHILIIDPNIQHCLSSRNHNSVFVNIQSVFGLLSIGSFYCPPSGDFEEDVRQWLNSKNQSPSQIVFGDFNAHSVLWGYNKEDARGQKLIDIALLNELIFLNSPNCIPTYETSTRQGRPDLTICSKPVFRFFKNWSVNPHLYGDHRSILSIFDYTCSPLPKRRFKTNVPLTKFKTLLLNNLRSFGSFNLSRSVEEFDTSLAFFENAVRSSAEGSLKKKAAFKPPRFTWWTSDLNAMRNRVSAFFRRAKRQSAPQSYMVDYRRERALYQRHIREVKTQAWAKFCKNETDVFGRVKDLAFQKYQDRLVTYISNNHSSPVSRSSSFLHLAQDIFGPSIQSPVKVQESSKTEPLFTMQELRHAIYSFNKNKAPGPDAIDHKLIRAIFSIVPNLILDMYNVAFNLNYFPSSWKLGELVFFKKEGKPDDLSSSFRPITLLPIFGKIFEKLIIQRIHYKIKSQNVLSGLQYGFTELKSTESALNRVISKISLNKERHLYSALISIDFKGAFDSLPWGSVREFLLRLGLPLQLVNLVLSFLNFRRVIVDWLLPNLLYFFSRGCPQGSVFGPFLWTALLETLLSEFDCEGCEIVSYADDVLLIVWGDTRAALESRGNFGLNFIQNWASSHSLTISREKCQAIHFGKPRILQRPPIFKLQNNNIKSVITLSYLGVLIDQHLSFLPHLNRKRQEINKITQNLYKFSALSGRLPQKFFRTWYISIMQRQIAYACSVWFPRMWRSHGQRLLSSVQRSVLILISRAYRNTSTHALQVLLGLPPLDLQLEAESKFVNLTRLGVSIDNFCSSDFDSKISKYNLPPFRESLRQCLCEDYSGEIVIYTDGSKMEEGTSAAFCVYNENNLIDFWQTRLSSSNSVFQAELLAIKHAIIWGISSQYSKFLIRTDSLSGLQALSKFEITNSLQSDILNLLISSSKLFYFNWVKGHSGVEGNELADSLAKSALSNLDISSSFLPTPPSYLKRVLRQELFAKWQLRWDTSDTGRFTYDFIKLVSTNYYLQDRYLFLFFTNHGPFQQHLYNINRSDSPLCICGKISVSTHYVFDCPLTSKFHLKKHRDMSLRDWFRYLIDHPVLLNKISDCVRYVEKFEHQFVNPLPYLP